jgi:hypothetical protein
LRLKAGESFKYGTRCSLASAPEPLRRAAKLKPNTKEREHLMTRAVGFRSHVLRKMMPVILAVAAVLGTPGCKSDAEIAAERKQAEMARKQAAQAKERARLAALTPEQRKNECLAECSAKSKECWNRMWSGSGSANCPDNELICRRGCSD